MPRALIAFVHNDFRFAKGDEVDADHPMVLLRPDLFDGFEPVDTALPPPDPSTKARPKRGTTTNTKEF